MVAIVVVLSLGLSATGSARLHVVAEVGPTDQQLHTERATLRCDAQTVRATGFLRSRGRAACRVVRHGSLTRVARAQRSNRVCSQIYGGPQRARIRGTIDRVRVDLTITRTDGCGTGDWARLQPLLGDPERGSVRTSVQSSRP